MFGLPLGVKLLLDATRRGRRGSFARLEAVGLSSNTVVTSIGTKAFKGAARTSSSAEPSAFDGRGRCPRGRSRVRGALGTSRPTRGADRTRGMVGADVPGGPRPRRRSRRCPRVRGAPGTSRPTRGADVL